MSLKKVTSKNMQQNYTDNPEITLDKVREGFIRFEQQGKILCDENLHIYKKLASLLKGSILEAGSGIGIGAEIIGADTATDKFEKVVDFNKLIYPDRKFDVWDITERPYKKHDVVVCLETIEHVKDYKQAIRNLIASANKDVWISTPNRSNTYLGQDRPWNPAHVHEFTPQEMLEIAGNCKIDLLDWKTFKKVKPTSDRTPMIYHIWLQ